MKKIIVSSIAAVSGVLVSVAAETATTQSAPAASESAATAVPAVSEKESETANSDVVRKIDAKSLLNDAFAKFAEDAGITYGTVTPDGRIYSKGSSPVDADYSSPQFIKSRAMAYERAYLKAVSQFMLDFYGHTTTEKLAEYYGNQSSNAEESPIAKAKGIGEKIKLLADAKLDKALAAEGVDADKYAKASVVEKRTLLRDAMAVRNASRVLHSSSGCIPVKTFEARGEDGRYYIGVIVRYDRTSKTLAACFKSKKRPAISKAGGLTVKDALPPQEEIVQNFGVRLYFDETGTPSLLSFGQFGSSYTGKSPSLAERAEEQALRQARNLADSGLTAFINSFIDASEESLVSEEISDSRIFTDDGNVTPEEANTILDKYRKNVKVTGRDTMAGRSTVFEKVVPHPNGHKVAVVVRRWSFGTVDAIRAIDNPVRPAPKAEKPAANKEGAGVREGRTYDF